MRRMQFVAALALFLAPAAIFAQSISPPLGDPISGSLYSESEMGGPSSSIIQGGANLTSPYLRNGLSDPLGFLIESTDMAPYVNSVPYSIPYSDVQSHALSESITAARISEYRNNRALMAGAAATDVATARLAFSNYSRVGGGRVGGTTASSFGGSSGMQSFAAGSLAASRSASGNPAAAGFLDPNALVTAMTSKTMRGTPGVGGTGGAGVAGGMGAAGLSTSYAPFNPDQPLGGLGPALGSDASGQLASIPVSGTSADGSESLAPNAASMAIGPAPGGLFPVPDPGAGTGFGFRDSTMGTAGLPYQASGITVSPLFSARYSGLAGSPFPSISSETGSFLHPTLNAGVGAGMVTGRSSLDLHEMARKARMRAMIYSPNAPLPSSFETRKMERAYTAHRHRSSRYSSFSSPASPSSPAK